MPLRRFGDVIFGESLDDKAGVAQLVEHDVANVVVESSNLFARSFVFRDEKRLLEKQSRAVMP